jgi:hypothetical protein
MKPWRGMLTFLQGVKMTHGNGGLVSKSNLLFFLDAWVSEYGNFSIYVPKNSSGDGQFALIQAGSDEY